MFDLFRLLFLPNSFLKNLSIHPSGLMHTKTRSFESNQRFHACIFAFYSLAFEISLAARGASKALPHGGQSNAKSVDNGEELGIVQGNKQLKRGETLEQ